MRTPKTALLVTLLATIATGCNSESSGTYLVMHFTPAGAPAGIASIDLQLMLGTRSDLTSIALPAGSTLPQDASLQIDEGEGTMTLRATARNAAGTELAVATVMPVITRGETTNVNISFAPQMVSDGGVNGAPATDGDVPDGDLPTDGSVPDGGGADATPLEPRLGNDTPSHDFGSLAQGAMLTRTIMVSNLGTAPTSILTVSLGAGATSFMVNSGCQGQTLAASASCAVIVTFSPTSAGAKLTTLTVTASAGGTVTSTLTGMGLANATLTITPPTQDFGVVTQGSSSTAILQVANGGGIATGVLTTALTGTDVTLFTITTNTCVGMTLPAGGTCSIGVRFAPTTAGLKSAALGISAAGGPSTSAALMGTGQAPGAISISTLTFATVPVGMTQSLTATVTNTGGALTGTMSFSLSGGNFAEFSIVAPDTCTGQTLAGAATCMVGVRFAPTSAGAKVASLMAAATPGGPTSTSFQSAVGSAPLTAVTTGTGTGTVTSSPAGISCGATCTASFTSSPVVLTATPAISSTFMGWSGSGCVGTGSCSVTLPAAGSATATFAIKTFPLTTAVSGTGSGTVAPSPGGTSCGASCTTYNYGTVVTLTPTPAANSNFTGWSGDCTGTGACSVALDGSRSVTAMFVLKTFVVTASATGAGTVASTPAGISCPGTCSAAFDIGTVVNLTAKPSVGSYFQSWGGDCAGPARLDCNVTATVAHSVSAQFVTQTYNTIFVSSVQQPINLGSAAAYDTVCNTLATTAGLNTAGNDGYIAWTSDGNLNGLARTRLGTARGFVRVNGKPFGDDITSMLSPTNKIFNAPNLDENGRLATVGYVFTGTRADGTLGNNCSNFTTASTGTIMKGAYAGSGGAGKWTAESNNYSCAAGGIILCMMKTKVAPLTPAVTAGKKIYMSNAVWAPAGGIAAAHARCNTDRPAGVADGTVKALLPTVAPASPASTWLNAAATYVRPDGQVVGSGALLRAGLGLDSGLWQDGTGAYVADPTGTWGGTVIPTDVPTDALRTCADWTSSVASSTAYTGDHEVASHKWWHSNAGASCSSQARLTCVEQ